MRSVWALALGSLRARRRRATLTAFGVLTAALVVGIAATIAIGLRGGFERAAQRADLPTVTARFALRDQAGVDARVAALPGLAARSYRSEFTGARLFGPRGRRLDRGVLEIVDTRRRRGYAIVAGHEPDDSGGQVAVEQGLARDWGLQIGHTLGVGRVGRLRISGFVLAPDNVAYPLVSTARVYLSRAGVRRRFGDGALPVNVALVWASPGASQDVLLAQARVSAFGLRDLSFVTRSGVRVILAQASGIVTALIVAFALVAAALAGVLLGASAQSEVLRRMPAIGVQRALGMTPGAVTAAHALEAALIGAPAALAGLLAGVLLARGPTERLLAALNELPVATSTTVVLVVGAWLAITALVTAGAALPAWLAARRPPAGTLRGAGDLHGVRGRGSARGGLAALGTQLVRARRARFAAIVTVLGAAAGVVLLMVALAGLLGRLRDDPATLGKRYQLSVRAPAQAAGAIAAVRGVRAAAPRYSVDAANSFELGSPVRLIAYPGDHTRFEAPPLASGHRARGPREAEIGAGLADAQGLSVGSTLAVQLPVGGELRFHVSGIVRALENEGRIAYIDAAPLLRADPQLDGPIAVRLAPGADRARAGREITAIAGRDARTVGGATGGSSRLLVEVLASVLRLLAGAVGLVCLYALVQTLALTARERRRALATLRAGGADEAALRRVLLGAAAAVCLPAAALGALLEAIVLGPAVARLTAGYAELSLAPSLLEVVLVSGGLALLALAAAGWTARGLVREPIARGLREEPA